MYNPLYTSDRMVATWPCLFRTEVMSPSGVPYGRSRTDTHLKVVGMVKAKGWPRNVRPPLVTSSLTSALGKVILRVRPLTSCTHSRMELNGSHWLAKSSMTSFTVVGPLANANSGNLTTAARLEKGTTIMADPKKKTHTGGQKPLLTQKGYIPPLADDAWPRMDSWYIPPTAKNPACGIKTSDQSRAV